MPKKRTPEEAREYQRQRREAKKAVTPAVTPTPKAPQTVTPRSFLPPEAVTPALKTPLERVAPVTPTPRMSEKATLSTVENSTIGITPPTQADVESGKAWVVLTGPYKGELRWHGKLAQSWKHAPCDIVDDVCMADHGPDYHPRFTVPQDDVNPMSAFIKRDKGNLGKLQAVAGALGKLGKEVRFGLNGPTITELAATIGQAPPAYPHPGKH